MKNKNGELTLAQILGDEQSIEIDSGFDQQVWFKIQYSELRGLESEVAFHFAYVWARVMQYFIKRGESVGTCAIKSANLAGWEEITEQQFRKALDLLLTTWMHKEGLLDWVIESEHLGRSYLEEIAWYKFKIGIVDLSPIDEMLGMAEKHNRRIKTLFLDVWFSVWPGMPKNEAIKYLRRLIKYRAQKEAVGVA